jgi:hypothetical protein
MTDLVQISQRRLRVAIYMSHDAAEDRLIGGRLGADVGVAILKLQLLVAKVVTEAAKGAASVLGAILVVERVVLDLLSHLF